MTSGRPMETWALAGGSAFRLAGGGDGRALRHATNQRRTYEHCAQKDHEGSEQRLISPLVRTSRPHEDTRVIPRLWTSLLGLKAIPRNFQEALIEPISRCLLPISCRVPNELRNGRESQYSLLGRKLASEK